MEKGGEKIDIYAKRVISNAGLSNTFSRLLPKELVQTTGNDYKAPMTQPMGNLYNCWECNTRRL